ncbi:MAG: hypothetical protein COB20_12595 [SAR86 cluster bacterium]|uniref:Uncharacterized protein n=1 Tax=SAR86 cluster bacterium TaxID=2030880 RepID=A0A2A4WZA3_9GAMM|nr:MAG: hypothetical protein COB20_12595 [SAR86 cluster bacterium]
MSFGITKTIPASRGNEGIESLFDGSLSEFEFHMAGKPSKLKVGDFVYTIFNDELRGRLEIRELVGGAVNPKSGKPRTLIIVDCPGEKIQKPVVRKGHRGTRYYDGANWQ